MVTSTIVPSPSGAGILSRSNGQVTSNTQFDMKRLAETGIKLRELAGEMKNIFPERDGLIEQIIFSLVTREHVLIWGTYGTGKSDLIKTLLGQIEGGIQFKIGLNKFMTESHLFGPPNPQKLREEGVYEYSKEGTILEAHYVVLDELFDASPALLRTLLGVLNEKMFKRGRDIKNADLLSAFASTNGNPEEQIRMRPELGAVVDRFLLQSKVEYLSDDLESPSRRRMYQKYLQGERPTVQLELAEIVEFSSVVTDACQITDPFFIEVYDQVIQAYRREVVDQNMGRLISDRRACKLLQLVEANALLHGRFDVALEDILAIKWGLCLGNDTNGHELFRQVAEPILEEAAGSWTQSVDEMQARLLENFNQQFAVMQPATDNESRINLYRRLTDLLNNVEAIQPAVQVNRDAKEWLQRQIINMRDEVHTELLG